MYPNCNESRKYSFDVKIAFQMKEKSGSVELRMNELVQAILLLRMAERWTAEPWQPVRTN